MHRWVRVSLGNLAREKGLQWYGQNAVKLPLYVRLSVLVQHQQVVPQGLSTMQAQNGPLSMPKWTAWDVVMMTLTERVGMS